MHERCTALTKSGNPCTAKPRPGRPYCLWHDPEAATLRSEISRNGGRASSNKARARKALPAEGLTNQELYGYLGKVFKDVIGGTLEPRVGTAAATIAKTMADLLQVTELEQRITSLEQERDRRRTA